MNMSTSHIGSVAVLRVNEPRLTYPMLADFSSTAIVTSVRSPS